MRRVTDIRSGRPTGNDRFGQLQTLVLGAGNPNRTLVVSTAQPLAGAKGARRRRINVAGLDAAHP